MSEETMIPVRYLRTHFTTENKAKVIGQEELLPESEAKSLASYGIVILGRATSPKVVDVRLPAAAAVTRIEQLLVAADLNDAPAITELERLRDQELAGGAPRARVLKALRSAKVKGLENVRSVEEINAE